MKILFFSDSHGRTSPILTAISAESPDLLLFGGDGAKDLEKIRSQFPDIPLKAVRGNCDRDDILPATERFSADGAEFFMAHGHEHRVRGGSLYALAEAASETGAKYALYGHTHRARIEDVGGIVTVNPGAICSAEPSCAVFVTDGKGGAEVYIKLI